VLSRSRLWVDLCFVACLAGCGSESSPNASETKVSEATTAFKPVSMTSPAPGEATWPQWRGPHRDGISREADIRTDWAMAPNVIWRHDIGTGYSSVSVVGKRLFTMGHPEGSGEEAVWCLNSENGDVEWSVRYPCTLLDHLHKGGPGATPTIDGEYIYTNSREGEVRKIAIASGDVAWVCDLRKELELDLPEWGFTCSPVLFENEILLEAGSVIAIDKGTGKVNWKTKAHAPGYGTPERFSQNGTSYLAALNNDGLSVIDLGQRKEVAFHAWESPYGTNATTPLYHDGQIFVSTGYNIGCALLNFTGNALSQVWHNKEMRNHMNSCILRNGYLYGFDGNSHIRRTVTLNCVSWADGGLQWAERGLGCGALSATPDHLLICSDLGELVLANITPESFEELGRVKVMDEQCWTVPVLCNGLVYCRGAEGTLACVDVRQGNRP